MVHHIGPTTLEVSQSKVRRCTFWKSTTPMTSFIPLFLRVYSHQESPLVHLLWSGPNTLLIFFVWCGSLSHCSFCKWTRNCKQNNTCTYGHPFIGSSIQPYQSSFGTGPRPPLQLGLGTGVWSAPECDCCIHTCPNIRTKGGNELEFDSIKPNKTGVNTPWESTTDCLSCLGLFWSQLVFESPSLSPTYSISKHGCQSQTPTA